MVVGSMARQHSTTSEGMLLGSIKVHSEKPTLLVLLLEAISVPGRLSPFPPPLVSSGTVILAWSLPHACFGRLLY